jgi:hypothetical protein
MTEVEMQAPMDTVRSAVEEIAGAQDAIVKLPRTLDGITFDSQAEATRYTVLRNREAAGLNSDLILEPSFELQEAFVDGAGKRHRAITYTADFAYTQDGRTVVKEVKGHAARDFSLRMRLFLYRHPEAVYKVVKTGEVLVV